MTKHKILLNFSCIYCYGEENNYLFSSMLCQYMYVFSGLNMYTLKRIIIIHHCLSIISQLCPFTLPASSAVGMRMYSKLWGFIVKHMFYICKYRFEHSDTVVRVDSIQHRDWIFIHYMFSGCIRSGGKVCHNIVTIYIYVLVRFRFCSFVIYTVHSLLYHLLKCFRLR